MGHAIRAARGVRLRLAEVAGAADVDVRPGHRRELLEEQAALHEPALGGRGGVEEVRVPALHVGHVVVDERDLPEPLAGPTRRRQDIVDPVLRRPEDPGHEVAEGPRDGAGERGDVDEMGRAEPLRVRHRVAEDESALGVGVVDLDDLAVQGPDDIAWPGRVWTGHVLDRRRDGQERRPGGEAGDGLDRADDRRRPRLVHLHLFHPVGRLETDAAGVEADALADDREAPAELVCRAFRTRAHDDHPRWVVAALPHRQEHPHPELARPIGLDDVDPQPVGLGDRARLVREADRREVVARPVRERPRLVGALGDDQAALRPGGRRPVRTRFIRACRDDDQLVQGRRRGLDLVPVDRLRLVAALDHPPRHELSRRRFPALEMARQVADEHGQGPHLSSAEAPLDCGSEAGGDLPVDLVGRSGGDREEAGRA